MVNFAADFIMAIIIVIVSALAAKGVKGSKVAFIVINIPVYLFVFIIRTLWVIYSNLDINGRILELINILTQFLMELPDAILTGVFVMIIVSILAVFMPD
jgi:hypothetical protein